METSKIHQASANKAQKKASSEKLAFYSLLAEREGFEPSIQFPVYTLSRRAPSADSDTSPRTSSDVQTYADTRAK